MAKKYENLENVPLFGEYTDPFVDRRVTGPSRPGKTLPFLEPDYRRSFDEEKHERSIFLFQCFVVEEKSDD